MHILWCMCWKFGVKFQRPPMKFHTNFEPIHRKICILLTFIFYCDLRYLEVVTSWALVRLTPGRLALAHAYCPLAGSNGSKAVRQIVLSAVTWDTMTVIWRHCDAIDFSSLLQRNLRQPQLRWHAFIIAHARMPLSGQFPKGIRWRNWPWSLLHKKRSTR